MINGFDLAHFDEPVLDVFSCRDQDAVSMVIGLLQHLGKNKYQIFVWIRLIFTG